MNKWPQNETRWYHLRPACAGSSESISPATAGKLELAARQGTSGKAKKMKEN